PPQHAAGHRRDLADAERLELLDAARRAAARAADEDDRLLGIPTLRGGGEAAERHVLDALDVPEVVGELFGLADVDDAHAGRAHEALHRRGIDLVRATRRAPERLARIARDACRVLGRRA